jgi:L-ascorbate metabolism protein UlaG (beta-lactamase superfamily)
MKITKYNQACLLIETNGIRILVDPGSIGLNEQMVDNEWVNIDAILVTHMHFDHCNDDAVNTIIRRDDSLLYTTNEVNNTHDLVKCNIIRENDYFFIGNIKIEVTKAIHGFLTPMKYNGEEIKENVGYIIDNGNVRLYVTSDTISFNNNYKCDVLCMPFNGNGLTMGIIDGVYFAKDINPKLLLPIHMQHPNPIMNPDIDLLKNSLERENINYRILGFGQTIEI